MTPITHLLPVHPTRDCKGVICKHKRIEEEDYDDDDDDDDDKDKRAHNMTNPSLTR
jgi:SUMO ligase MMS21 Smc5/6 complex component